jgi:hypothetical protein
MLKLMLTVGQPNAGGRGQEHDRHMHEQERFDSDSAIIVPARATLVTMMLGHGS